ncbi:FLYWCH-type domain-containing protein [Aphis craccivora]|uniref:FLYWCH-type domain-containing protein n=1 Tax=Aphis craccivora TaxID=307492 RepID=A0A6G0Z7V7_APHCR|nr:FLYWCH-type domain-containing protein [Aphis craccivora]
MLDGLAFLTINKVYDGMKYLKTVPSEVLDYFDSTYVNGTYRKSGKGMNIKLKKNKPLFSLEKKNVHEATVNSQQRTNNICESWNNRFTHLVFLSNTRTQP